MDKKQPLVTCVIPVYNGADYLEQGLRSLLTQTYKNLEIILVDDVSTDDSWGICRKYVGAYPNIRAFKNAKNSGGPLRGREKGIKEARGEWIAFMDCDDYVRPTYIENLWLATMDGKYDIAVTGHSRLHSNGKVEDFLWKDYTQTTTERLESFYIDFITGDYWNNPANTIGQNLVRASLAKSTDFSIYSSRIYGEDLVMALALLANSENGINFVDKHDFFWRQREGSGSHGGFSGTANKQEFTKACFDIFHRKDLYQSISRKCPLVSVIVPVYNVEKYLRACLDSIVNQTYKNLEIIIVNDGTKDNSQVIIDSYKKHDSRIKAIKQKNLGLNMARASGVKAASGAYITFVDADDILHEEYVRSLYECLTQNGVDISVCGFGEFHKDSEVSSLKSEKIDLPVHTFKSKIEALTFYLSPALIIPHVYQMTACGKLCKTEDVKSTDWKLSNYRRNEDNLEVLQWFNQASKGVVVLPARLYFYRNNPTSITQTPKSNISPDGRTMNHFEFLRELYTKTKEYLQDNTYDLAVLNQFGENTRLQLLTYYMRGWLDDETMKYATMNTHVLIDDFNEQIRKRDNLIQQRDAMLQNILRSFSWRITRPARGVKKLYKSFKVSKR